MSKKVLIMELLIVLCQCRIGDIFLTDKCVLSRIPFLQRGCRRIFPSVILKPANFDTVTEAISNIPFPVLVLHPSDVPPLTTMTFYIERLYMYAVALPCIACAYLC